MPAAGAFERGAAWVLEECSEIAFLTVGHRRLAHRVKDYESDGVLAIRRIRAVQGEWGNNHTLLVRVVWRSITHTSLLWSYRVSLLAGVRQVLCTRQLIRSSLSVPTINTLSRSQVPMLTHVGRSP